MRLLALAVVTAVIGAGVAINGRVSSSSGSSSVASAGVRGLIPVAEDTSRNERDARSERSDVHDVTLPAGTRLPIVLEQAVGSDISRVEEPVRAHLSRAVRVGNETALPSGSRVEGVVTDATRSGKVKGRAHIGIRFQSLTLRDDAGQRYQLRTATLGRLAPATKKDDALKIGLPAAGGAIVGGLLGGKKGAAIGGAAGGGAGTAVVMSTRGKEVRLARGTPLTIRLTAPLTVHVGR